MRIKQPLIYIAIPTFLLAWLAYFMQTKMFLSPDVGYLLQATRQLLIGGKYGSEIFETNPPMILYLYAPVWMLVKMTAMDVIMSLRLYVFFLALVSLVSSYVLLKKIIKPKDSIILYVLFYTLVISMFFSPTYSLGQREHLLFILMVPYLLAAVVELEGKSLHPFFKFFIGLLAGMGFALKPFFLVTLCLVELLFIINRKRLFGWVRIESVTIASILVLYLGSIFLFQPDYIDIILPLVFQFYFIAIKQPLSGIFSDHFVIFCVVGTLAYFVFYKQDTYRTFSTVIWVALVGMIAAFIIPRAAWFYHQLPALSLVCLLLANYFSQILSSCVNQTRLIISIRDSFFLILALFFILLVPVSRAFQFVQHVCEKYLASETRQRLISYINSQPGKHSVFCFSGKGDADCFPLIYLTQSEYGSRFPFFWWYAGLLTREKEGFASSTVIAKHKKFLIDNIAEDLDRYQARWIIINTLEESDIGKSEIISHFSENQNFQNAWKHYHLTAVIDNYQIYERQS